MVQLHQLRGVGKMVGIVREQETDGAGEERGRPKVLLEVYGKRRIPTRRLRAIPRAQSRALKSQVLESGGNWSQIVACNESEQAEMQNFNLIQP